MEQPVLMSLIEWIDHTNKKNKKKEPKNVSRSSEASGQVGAENVQGQDSGNHQALPVERFSLFPMSE
jgi:hypothetical protein